jgi:hypothetical protein
MLRRRGDVMQARILCRLMVCGIGGTLSRGHDAGSLRGEGHGLGDFHRIAAQRLIGYGPYDVAVHVEPGAG